MTMNVESVSSANSCTSSRSHTPSSSNNSSPRKLTFSKSTNCFVCNVDTKDSSYLKIDSSNYPLSLYSKIFNHFAKILVIKDSQKRIVELSHERAKVVNFCAPCLGQVLQLYRLCNSPNNNSSKAQQHIKVITNLLKFKLAFAKRNNSKIRHIVTAHADPTKYHVNGYWHLRITEENCSRQMYNAAQLGSTLSTLDISKLSANDGIYDESNSYLTSPDLDDASSPSVQEEGDGENEEKLTYGDSDSEDDDDNDSDIGTMVRTGRIAPIELVQVNMGNEFSSFNEDKADSSGLPIFNVPVGEIKPPRKQILASRVGVSSKAPIIKTIIRDKSGIKAVEEEIPDTGEPKAKKPFLKLKPTDDDMELDIYSDGDGGENENNSAEDEVESSGDPETKPDTEVSCPLCSKTFATRSTMVSHLYSHRQYFCKKCRQHFETEKIYKDHNKSQHSGKSDTCFICGKEFSSDLKFSAHFRSHQKLGHDTYRCSVDGCTATFKTKVDCITHLRECPPRIKRSNERSQSEASESSSASAEDCEKSDSDGGAEAEDDAAGSDLDEVQNETQSIGEEDASEGDDVEEPENPKAKEVEENDGDEIDADDNDTREAHPQMSMKMRPRRRRRCR